MPQGTSDTSEKDDVMRFRCPSDLIRRFKVYKEYHSFKDDAAAFKWILDLAENKAKAEKPGYPF